jgi:hypothetical protein
MRGTTSSAPRASPRGVRLHILMESKEAGWRHVADADWAAADGR